MPHVTANGVRLYYEERGSGVPILGVHGAGSTAIFWEDAAETLSALGRAIVYDRRGCTRSERPDPYDTTSIREHADDAYELLRALDALPAIIIGRSYGGTVGLDLALRHPESVLGLALLEAGPMGLSAGYDAWFDSLRGMLEDLASSGRSDAIAETVAREALGAWEELPDSFRENFTANGPALLAEIRGEERLSDGVAIGELRVPTIIVSASDSGEPHASATVGLERALPQARTVRVEGGHIIDPAGPAVLEFVAEILAAPGAAPKSR